jgi:hypothetical protein
MISSLDSHKLSIFSNSCQQLQLLQHLHQGLTKPVDYQFFLVASKELRLLSQQDLNPFTNLVSELGKQTIPYVGLKMINI